jgi:23S rRNA (uridine2552-2'-O)-methyltransferase
VGQLRGAYQKMRHYERMRRKEFYYRQAKKHGYRSRAAYKLKQLHRRYDLFKRGWTVLDVGAAPGGWSQIAAQYVAPHGKVYAVDIEVLEPIPNVISIKGDITSEETKERLKVLIDEPIDIVICDISPDVTGNWSTDHARQIYLAEQALKFSLSDILKQGGRFVCKLFQGDLFERYISNLKQLFMAVHLYKPRASRKKSAEIYVVAKGLKQGPLKRK